LPSKYKALSSNPSTTPPKQKERKEKEGRKEGARKESWLTHNESSQKMTVT
jgi:hypothetical protein